MKRLVMVLSGLLFWATPGWAQADYPKVEVYGGFAYASLALLGVNSRQHSVGGGASISGNFSRYFGLTADYAIQADTECSTDLECIQEFLSAAAEVDFTSQQFLAGPRFTVRTERVTWFAHALFGAAWSKVSVTTSLLLGPIIQTSTSSGPDFAMGYGSGLDLSFSKRVALRLFQIDYIPIRADTGWRQNFRIQGGIVFRFGNTVGADRSQAGEYLREPTTRNTMNRGAR